MIIYGSRAVHLASAQPTSITCPSCGTQGSLVISTFRRHAHIFWIPLFPIGKTGVSQCQHCKQVMKVKEMPNNIRKEYEYVKDEKRGPLCSHGRKNKFSDHFFYVLNMRSGFPPHRTTIIAIVRFRTSVAKRLLAVLYPNPLAFL